MAEFPVDPMMSKMLIISEKSVLIIIMMMKLTGLC